MKEEMNVKMFLFARWISTCYADEHLDEEGVHQSNQDYDAKSGMSVLNREDGEWWERQLNHFNLVVYPNYVENGTVEKTSRFLTE